MKEKTKDRGNNQRKRKSNVPLRRSLRLKLLAVSVPTDRSSTVKTSTKSIRLPSSKARKRKYVKHKSTGFKQSKDTKKSHANQSKTGCKSPENETELSTASKPSFYTKQSSMKPKLQSSSSTTKSTTNGETSDGMCTSNVEEEQFIDPKCTEKNQIEKQEFQLTLQKTIKIAGVIRFSDVAFLDDNHILALDDTWLSLTHGQRICCIYLDGTLICDLLVSGYPWSVVVLSPTEAVVSVRRLESNGLLWISVNALAKSIEVTRHVPLEAEPYGLSYIDRTGLFLVSYCKQPYLSVMNKTGEEIRRIECHMSDIYRCLFLEDEDESILLVDNLLHLIRVMGLNRNVARSIQHSSILNPTAIDTDRFGNIYVGNFRTGEIVKFDRHRRYQGKFLSGPNLCGIGIDKTSSRIIATRNDSLLVYDLG
ncbi:hypothetical protein FSP39_009487 [Pinctada imbricata]|uniref:Uncharacterized protein n=1 Tax=Pinctada imbricata TaxID=66713 RepID=A0AA89BT90_PINIB|nr:hypothetical protein FSP39_009487 [Pinctada imbricata]